MVYQQKSPENVSFRAIRVLTKSRKNEALIRNDGMYVISGIFSRANACKKVKARRAEVASTRSAQARNTAQAKRRAVRNVKMHSRPDRWPLEAAKRLEARAHAVRSAGTLGRLRRHSAKTSDRVILVDKPKVCQRSEAHAIMISS